MTSRLIKTVLMLACSWTPKNGQVLAFAPLQFSSLALPRQAQRAALLSALPSKDSSNNSINNNDSTNNNNNNNTNALVNRRQALLAGIFLATSTLTVATAAPPPAAATYTAYTQREQDWEERIANGKVQVSSARSLRSQLKEIVPMNDESSKIFCPNGPSAAVSPLMENKCGDRQALPSVYGRTDDAMGNSVPGFKGGKYESGFGPSTLSAESVGGYPVYKFK